MGRIKKGSEKAMCMSRCLPWALWSSKVYGVQSGTTLLTELVSTSISQQS